MSLFRKALLVLAVAAAVWSALLLFAPSTRQGSLFLFSAQERIFNDFFCPRSVVEMEHPYSTDWPDSIIGTIERKDQCYPALAVFLSGMFSESYSGAIACQIAGVVVFFVGLFMLLRKFDVPWLPVSLVMTVSSPFLFSIEVGNQILFAAGLSFVFLAWYNSERMACRVVAAIALALAAVLKITPAILGLAYVCTPGRRNWRGAVLSGAIFCVLFLVPFIFLGGLDGFVDWLENANANSKTYEYVNGYGPYGIVSLTLGIVGYTYDIIPPIYTPLRIISSAYALVVLFRTFREDLDEFSRICLVVIGMLFLPPTMMCYTALYILPLLAIGAYRYQGKLGWIFTICWVTLSMPLQIPVMLGSATAIISAAALLDLSVILSFKKL